MRYYLGPLLIIILICLSPTADARVPEIENNTLTDVEEYQNPFTLNWTVTDDNLRSHSVYIGTELVDEGRYNFTRLRSIDIVLEVSLGSGKYNFTLSVTDAENNTITDSFQITKGSEPEALRTLPISNLGIIIAFLLILTWRKVLPF